MTGELRVAVDAYAIAAVVCLLAACLGYPLVRRVVGWPLRLPLSVLAGSAALSACVALLAWAHLFYGAAVAVVGVAAGVATLLLLARDLRGADIAGLLQRTPRRTVIVASLCLGAGVMIVGLLSLYPYFGYDTTSYHLPMARDLVQQHQLVSDPTLLYPFFPQANEALYAVCMLLSSDPVVTHAYEFILCTCAVVIAVLYFPISGRSVGAGLAAGALLLASPIAVHTMTTALVEGWVLAFLVGALVVGLLLAEGRVRSDAWTWALVGTMLGAAGGAKYTGLGFAAIVGVAIVAVAPRARLLPGVVAAAAAAAVILLLWYAQPVVTTHDPFYPYLTSVFGNHGGYSAQDITEWEQATRDGASDGLLGTLDYDLKVFQGIGHFEVPPLITPLSALIFVPFLGLLLRGLVRSRVFLAALGSASAMLLVWVAATPDQRYAVPITGSLAIAAGLLVAEVMPWLRPHLNRLAVLAAAPVLTALVLAESILFVHAKTSRDGLPPTNAAAVDAYTRSLVSCYSGVTWLNATYGAAWTGYAVRCEEVHFYAQGTLYGNRYGVASWPLVLANPGADITAIDARATADNLAALNARWLLVPAVDYRFSPGVPLQPAVLTSGGRFRVAYADDQTVVFEVLPAPTRA